MIPPTVTRRSSKSERLAPPKQQPQSVSACLDTVLYFWTWNGFGTDKCMACGTCSLSTTTIWRGTTFPTTTTATCCTRGGISALQNSGIWCFMPRKDGPLWQQYRIGTYTRTVDNLISHKLRAAVVLHRGDIMLFTGNFQTCMQHKAPSFDKWSGKTASQFMLRYPGRDISEEFETAKLLSTWGGRAVVTCRIIRSHEKGCPYSCLQMPRAPPPPPPVPVLHSEASSSSRQAPPVQRKVKGSGPVVPPPPPGPPPATATTQRPARLTVLRGMQPTLKAASPRSEASSPVQTRHSSFLFLLLIRFVALISAWLALATAFKS